MQATMNTNALAPSPRLQFARRGYMVRSEKRRRPSSQKSSDQGSRRPPRKRRPRAGFFYKFFMTLLLLTLWPFGLIMLWSQRLRWGGLTKFFTSVVTLMACILLIGSVLTLETNNPQFTAVQSRINGFLDVAADSMIDFGTQVGARVERSMEAVDELTLLYQEHSLIQLADAIDSGVEFAQGVRGSVEAFFSGAAGDEPAADADDPSRLLKLEKVAAQGHLRDVGEKGVKLCEREFAALV